LVLSEKFQFLHRSLDIFLLSLKMTCLRWRSCQTIALAVFPPPPTYIMIVSMLLMTLTLYFLSPASPLSNLASHHHGLWPCSPKGLTPASIPCCPLPDAATKLSTLVCRYCHLLPTTAVYLVRRRLLSATKSVAKSRPPPLSPRICCGCL
jgi:hypothetical protein